MAASARNRCSPPICTASFVQETITYRKIILHRAAWPQGLFAVHVG